MAVVTHDRGRPSSTRLRRFIDRALRAAKTNDAEELERLGHEAEEMEEHRDEAVKPADTGSPEGDKALHVHVHTGDEDEEPDDGIGEDTEDRRRRGRDAIMPGEEPDGDEPATKGDIAQLLMLIKEMIDPDEEDEDLDGEEEQGGEVADRRMAVKDRRRRARDAFRKLTQKFMDEVGEIVELEHDPESSGRNDAPGTAGAGKEGIRSEPVHRSTGDRATMDSRSLQPSWDQVVSQAEILAPGIELYESGRKIAFDALAPAAVTDRRICALRRRSLDAALGTASGRAVIDQVTAGQTVNLRTVSCDALTPIFNGASALMAERNRAATRMPVVATADAVRTGMAMTVADINKQNRERDEARRRANGITK